MLNERSLKKLDGINPDLRRVVMRAAELMPNGFIITEGVRSIERQRELFAKGLSKTMNSRHITGHAIDFAPLISGGEVTWKWAAFPPVAQAFKDAASQLGVAIIWGGDWKRFKDGPHIELDRRSYP